LNNPYIPVKAEILDIVEETSSDQDIKSFKVKLLNDAAMTFSPGQFLELSIPGAGEAPFGFASSPLVNDHLELCIKKIGGVTQALHNLAIGSVIYLRGPFGNTFPIAGMEGGNLLFVAGGLGLAPLRPLILYILAPENRGKFGKIQMLFTARSSGDFIFKRDFESWRKEKDTEIVLAIDRMEEGWKEKVGFPNKLVEEMGIDCANTCAVLCGPPIMIKVTSSSLVELGIPKDKIITTLENRMTCGVGKCGKCNVGHRYVCVDGPVFRMSELSGMPGEY
jgi:NAD(P)H-flavin reductase